MQWSDLLHSSSYSTPFHSKSWIDAWSNAFGYRARYLLVRDFNGEIIAGMPFMELRYKAWINYESMPWGCYGGVVTRSGTDPEVSESILDYFCLIAGREKVRSAIIVDFFGIMSALGARCASLQEVYALVLDTNRPFDDIYTGYDYSIKKNLRKADRQNILIRDVGNEIELEEYCLMADVIAEKYGRKPYPRQLFLNIYKLMVPREEAKFTMAFLGNKAIAGALHIMNNGHVFNWLTVSYPETLIYRPVEAVDSNIIEWSCANGYRLYNFGASPINAHSLIKFKEKWGTKRLPYTIFQIENKADSFSGLFLSTNLIRRVKNRLKRIVQSKPNGVA